MCNPMAVMVGLTLFSTVTTMKAQRDQGQYQEGVGKYNARVTENSAKEYRNATNEAENAHRAKVNQLISRQRAQLGAAGVEIDSGSPLAVQEDAITLGEADALRIRSNATQQISAMNTQAQLYRSQGSAAAIAGSNDAIGSLLSGVSSVMGSGVADKWFTPNSVVKQKQKSYYQW